LQDEIQGLRQQKTDLQQMLAHHKCTVNNGPLSNSINQVVLNSNDISELNSTVLSNNDLSANKRIISINVNNNIKILKCEDPSSIQSNKNNINNIPTTVLQQPNRIRPSTLSHFDNSKKVSGQGSSGVVVLNFDSLMEGGTGLTPISTNGSIQNQQVQISNLTDNNSVLS